MVACLDIERPASRPLGRAQDREGAGGGSVSPAGTPALPFGLDLPRVPHPSRRAFGPPQDDAEFLRPHQTRHPEEPASAGVSKDEERGPSVAKGSLAALLRVAAPPPARILPLGLPALDAALPEGGLAGDGPWAELTVRSAPVAGTAPVPTAIEQFDLQSPGVTMWAFGEGFHEPELDNAQALSWRWMSERAVVEVPQAAGDLTLVVRGESPRTYFPGPSTFEVRAGEALLARVDLSGDFTVRVGVRARQLDAAGGRLVLTTTQSFAPAERGPSGDQRRLGLRLFAVDVQPGVPETRSEPNSGQKSSDLR